MEKNLTLDFTDQVYTTQTNYPGNDIGLILLNVGLILVLSDSNVKYTEVVRHFKYLHSSFHTQKCSLQQPRTPSVWTKKKNIDDII